MIFPRSVWVDGIDLSPIYPVHPDVPAVTDRIVIIAKHCLVKIAAGYSSSISIRQ